MEKKNINCDYFMSTGEADNKLNNSQLEKELGDTFDPNLNIHHHIYEITNKATKTLDTVNRTFLF